MNTFEERLLGALKQEMAAGPAQAGAQAGGQVVTPVVRRPRRRLVGLAAAAGVAAVATVAATGLFGGAPAYAVTGTADGGVSVEINAFRDPDGLASELAAAGVRSVVDYLPYGQVCKEPRGQHGTAEGRFEASIGSTGHGISFKIPKGQVPAGQTLVLAVTLDRSGPEAPPVSTSLQIVKGAVAPCEPTAMPAPPTDGPTDRSGTRTGTGEGTGGSNGEGTGDGPGWHTEQG
ncbi:hypothetical protein ACIBQ6_41880 [Nonomuraea sp. NPDC049655]|uniref:hypothetical protein n=1 Tax=Nonomuraea sp. NPDC049655 TaxID=3364355 RepID=UPI00378C2FED